jgi:hypothetical protein
MQEDLGFGKFKEKDMREILFRGKDIVGNWYAGNLAVLEKDLHMGATTVRAGSYISNSCGSPFAYQIRPETVGQFTGLLDKNRKKIFEGDIVLIEGHSIGVIRYLSDEALFAVDLLSHLLSVGDTILSLSDTTSEYIEVIGNIYDNPELLS